MNNIYREKYLKYKKKYLILKKMIGGFPPFAIALKDLDKILTPSQNKFLDPTIGCCWGINKVYNIYNFGYPKSKTTKLVKSCYYKSNRIYKTIYFRYVKPIDFGKYLGFYYNCYVNYIKSGEINIVNKIITKVNKYLRSIKKRKKSQELPRFKQQETVIIESSSLKPVQNAFLFYTPCQQCYAVYSN